MLDAEDIIHSTQAVALELCEIWDVYSSGVQCSSCYCHVEYLKSDEMETDGHGGSEESKNEELGQMFICMTSKQPNPCLRPHNTSNLSLPP